MSLLWVPGGWVGAKYQVVDHVGTGGMAEVWRGVMRGTAGFVRPVAIKRILPQLLAVPEFVGMFVEEASILSQLIHANIVQVFDFERDAEGGYFLVMEWVEGLDLQAYLKTYARQRQRTPWPLIAAVAIETLRGLAAAHEHVDGLGRRAAVIHRDVTPQNIILGTSGCAKLTDFGLARATDRARRTSPGIVKGKLAYLAPETTRDQPPSPQSDIFSLGVVLWEALAGRPLYAGGTDVQIFDLARNADIPPLAEIRGDLPAELLHAIGRALERAPEDRFPSARDFLRHLTGVLRRTDQPADSYALSHSVIEARCILGQPPPGILRRRPPPPPDGERAKAAATAEVLSEEDLLDLLPGDH